MNCPLTISSIPREQRVTSATAAVTRRARLPGIGGGGVRSDSTFTDYDEGLLWVSVLLLLIGLVMVYSSSIAFAEGSRFTGYRANYFLWRHAASLLIAGIAAWIAFQVPMVVWQRFALPLFLLGVALLVLVLIPGIGRNVNGAQRWIPLGISNLQPSELMKLFAIFYAADYTVRKAAVMHSFKEGFMPMAIAMIFVGWLLLREPDLGAFAVIVLVAIGVLFLGGMNARLFFGLIIVLLVSFALLIMFSEYRRQRIIGFMDPWSDAYGKGYQLSHALIAFGRGEWFGVGLGNSIEKLFYLPEAHTDFLFAVIAEELGFAGVLAIILMFFWITRRAFEIGRQALALERTFAALVAQGVALWLGVQTLINMGVNMGLLPTKGLTLPLMSFGGSGILANCIALAVLLRVDFENRRLMRGLKA